jgi:hypothetical protein
VHLWELDARESIRDIVTRYNANGDTGRFAQVLELFTDDATMETTGPDGGPRVYRGLAEITTIFTGTKDRWAESAQQQAAPPFIRHCVFTHQIDLIDESQAKGRSYFQVLMSHGLDHWGRYIDDYAKRNGRWLFAHRKVILDSRIPGGRG